MFLISTSKKLFNKNNKKGSIWLKLAFVLAILLIIAMIVNANKTIKEGFSFEKKF